MSDRDKATNIWLTLYRFSMVVFILLLIVAVGSLFLPAIRKNQERARKVNALEEENRLKEDAVKQLQKNQEQFVADPKFVERIAREELGKAKTGETVFKFSDRKTNAVHARP